MIGVEIPCGPGLSCPSIYGYLTIIMAFVVYFFIVKPYERAKARFFPAQPDADTIDPDTELLREIRDELRQRA